MTYATNPATRYRCMGYNLLHQYAGIARGAVDRGAEATFDRKCLFVDHGITDLRHSECGPIADANAFASDQHQEAEGLRKEGETDLRTMPGTNNA